MNATEIKPQKVLVTGGGGFIGRHVVERLLGQGHHVTITATGTEPTLKVHKVLYMSLEGIDWRQVYGQDIVVHLMANNDTRCTDNNEMWRANVYGPIKLFSSAYDGGCRKFVYASSTAVYGNSPAPYHETTTPIKPLHPYAESKAKFDEFADSFAKENSVAVTGLRYCNVYGPGEDHKGKRMSMVGQIIRKIIADQSPQIFIPGDQRRDWVYVKDAADATVSATNCSAANKFAVYNIGSGRSHSFNDLIRVINSVVQVKTGRNYAVPAKYVECPFADEYQSHTECAIKNARSCLAFFPRYDLRSGIEEYVESLISDDERLS